MNDILSSLSIFPATSAQSQEATTRSFVEWGAGLPLDRVLSREDRLEKCDHAMNAKLTIWVLAPRNDPQTLDFMCACETFSRDGIIKMPKEEQVQTVTCYGIASVFTPKDKRKKGYAKHMMRLIHWAIGGKRLSSRYTFPIDEWGPAPMMINRGDAPFSALWSDVGKDFYRLCQPVHQRDGWVVQENRETTWKVSDFPLPNDTAILEWELLDEEAVLRVWDQEVDRMKLDMTRLNSESGKVLLSFLPNNGVSAFQHRRLTEVLQVVPQTLDYWGLSMQDNPSVFATWTVDVRPSRPISLVITLLRSSVAQFPSLLSGVVDFAQGCGFEEVKIWNLQNELVECAQTLGGATGEKEDHLPCLAFYDDEFEVEWLFNQKFCWC